MQKVSDYKTATAYAEAWLDAAKDRNAEDIVLKEVQALDNGIGDIAALWAKLSTPLDDDNLKVEVIASFAKEANLSDISTEALKLIATNGRLNLIQMILTEFKHLYYQNKGIVEVMVESAVQLSEAQDKKLRKMLEEKLKAPIIIDYQINPAVLGGLAVRYGSFLIDDTIKSKLGRIEKLLAQRQV